MDSEQLKNRTKKYALRILHLSESLPNSKAGNAIEGQLVRCGSSVASNYRSACRAKSKPDFIYKLAIVEEECDESLFWMEMLIEAGPVKPELLTGLIKEGSEILSIVVSSIKTSRSRK